MHFNALHKAKELRRFDFADAKELQTLGELLASADVVIEGSRPRALRALGLDRESLQNSTRIAAPSQLWLSLWRRCGRCRWGMCIDGPATARLYC